MTRDLFLGADVGTSSVKAVVTDAAGTVLGRGHAAYTASHPRPGWFEQDPDDWWHALASSVRAAVADAGVSGEDVAALALSTQGGTLVPVDASGRPTRPAIVWADQRCDAERREVVAELGEREVYDRSGWLLGPNLNLLQTRWLRAHDPDAVARTARYLSVPDHLAERLCGRAVLDPSNAGVNQLGDYATGEWAPVLLEAAGLTPSELGELRPAGEAIGPLTGRAASDLGLTTATQVVNGGHDQYCVALGLGAVEPGDTFVGSGTAWVVTVVTERPRPDLARGHCVSRHVVPGRYGSLASLESGGECLEWWRRLVARDGVLPGWAELSGRPPTDPAGTPLFFPFLHGCWHPRHVPELRGALWGLEGSHDAWALADAVQAGVVFQTAWMLDTFERDTARPLVFTGGAARSEAWVQLLADVSGTPVHTVAETESGALGAALLAARGVGLASTPAVRFSGLTEPGSRSDAWQERFADYRTVAAHLLAAQDDLEQRRR